LTYKLRPQNNIRRLLPFYKNKKDDRMAKSLKKNYIFSLIYTLSGMLFPLITFPYAARILMADGIGQVNFYASIIQYIVLFTCLGIPLYAIRETARVRDNKEQLNKTTLEILVLHTGLTLLGYIAVFVLCVTVTKIQANIPLFLLLSTTVFFNAIGVEWFYQGNEDFKYITIRGLTVKTLMILYLFICVRTKDDLLWYGLYTVLGSVGNNLFNFIHLRKYLHININIFKELRPLRHLAPALRIFVFNLVTSIYVNLDTVMLGFMQNNDSVGYYTGATKLTKLLMGIITSLGTVMLPRLSNLVQKGEHDEFKRLSQRAIDYVMTMSVPIAIGLLVMSPTLIHIFCGDSYDPAITTLQIISPIIIVIAMSQVIGLQILYPQGKEKLVIISTCVGALVNLSLNMLLIPKYSHNGAAIATVIAETLVTITQLVIAHKFIPVRLFTGLHIKCIASSLFMGAVCYALMRLQLTDIQSIIIIPMTGVVVYGILLVATKNPFVFTVKQMVTHKQP
jgi:O-antigen/teichoic acid export membrane protein